MQAHSPQDMLQRRARMLADLDTRWPTTPGAPSGPHPGAPWLLSALLPLVPSLLEALAALERDPRLATRRLEGSAPLRSLRRPDQDTLRWLMRRPEQVARHGERSVPAWSEERSLEDPANRYLAWLLRRIPPALRHSAQTLTLCQASTARARQRAQQNQALARALLQAASQIHSATASSWLASLPGAPPSDAALLAILDDPRYARLQSLARRFLSPRFQLQGQVSAPPPHLQPERTLYGLWVLLTLRDLWESKSPQVRWRLGGARRTPPRGLYLRGEDPAGTVTIALEVPFPSWLRRGQSPRYAMGSTGRPSVTLHWRPHQGAARWCLLETPWHDPAQPLEPLLDELHQKRGALLWQPAGPASGALLATPCAGAKPATHRELLRHGAGSLALVPGQPVPDELGQWLWPTLGLLGPALALERR